MRASQRTGARRRPSARTVPTATSTPTAASATDIQWLATHDGSRASMSRIASSPSGDSRMSSSPPSAQLSFIAP